MKELESKDYELIGRYVVGESIKYINAINKHSELIHEQNENDKAIHVAEENKDMQALDSLYKKFREIKNDLIANRSFRQFQLDKMMSNIDQIVNPQDYMNPIKIEELTNE